LGGWRRHREDLEATIRGQLGAAWRERDPARALPLDDAVALALNRSACCHDCKSPLSRAP
ncbi:MAG TPA: hypothetical protein VHK46_05020, partial [Gaiellaceae bacterium]|nr:hypothetical protein [Gaiellaceae bacterium]